MSEWTAEVSGGELTGMQMWFIRRVYHFSQNGDVFQRDLERSFGISRATASNILKLMEERGLILRQEHERDARLKRIILTERSLALCEKNMAELDRMETALAAGIPEADIEVFFRVLEQVKQNLPSAPGAAASEKLCCPEVNAV